MQTAILLAAATASLMAGAAPAAAPAGAAPAAAPAGAEAFLRSLYGHYVHNEFPPYRWQRLLVPDLRRQYAQLMSRKEEPAFLDADPVCTCQDYGPFRVDRVQVLHASANGVTASVTFTNFIGTPNQRTDTVGFELVRARDGWEIADILFADHRHRLRNVVRDDLRR